MSFPTADPAVRGMPPARRRPAWILAAVLGVVALSLVPLPVVAAGAPVATVPVMIVLDASGSMNQSDAPGPRIDAAKAAITGLVDGLPTGAQVGLAVYGTQTGSADGDRAAGCADIRTLAPVGPVAAEAIKSQVAAVQARGYTPIGAALRAAAAALPVEGPRSIVLVSDGEDTCAPPAPCEVARELEQQGVDLTVQTVGFKVDAAARDQLSCIAQATGGTYRDAADSGQLSTALSVQVDHAITGYTTAGTPVNGEPQASGQAPLLEPGQYVDTFAVGGSGDTASPGTTKYYTVPVQAGRHPYISATIIPPDDNSGGVDILGVDLDLMRRDLRSCNRDRGYVVVHGPNVEAVTGVLDGPTFGDKASPANCPTDGQAVLQITRIGKAWADKPLVVEIVVRMEPPADASGLLPEASEGEVLPAPVPGTPVALTGGSSFNDAPAVTSGTTYSATLVTGESRYFRVPLQWGQRLSYLLTEVGPAQPAISGAGSLVWVDLFNPVRETVTRSTDTGGRSWFGRDRQTAPFASSTRYPVRYTNRNGSEQRDFSLDGDYYLRINADRYEQAPSTTTFQLTVVVSGDAEPGPVYLAAGSVTTTTTTAATTAVTTPSTGASVVGTGTPTGPSAATSASVPIVGAGTSPPGNVSPADPGGGQWRWALLGAAVTAGLGAAGWLVVRRRRSSTGPTDRFDQFGSHR